MKLFLLICAIVSFMRLHAQNVGVGTNNPQQKLHVAGNVRVDGLAGMNGIMRNTTNGDLVTLPLSGDTNHVLLGNGGWGTLNGTIPVGTLVATTTYNNTELINRGFRLFGYIPGVNTFSNVSFFAPANSWATTYTEGNPEKYSPPDFDANRIFFWVDTVMYVFANNNFYIYNPVSDVWRFGFTNPTAFTATTGCKMIWTGTELIVWGGNYTIATNNGFRYNPSTNVWTAIPTAGQPSARTHFGMELVSNRLIVWGGFSSVSTILGDGAVLNLATNTWSPITATGAPSARRTFVTVANTVQNTMMLWGGTTGSVLVNDGARYNPVNNTWSAMSTINAPAIRQEHTATWSGTEMIIYGGSGQTTDALYLNTGARYNPVANTWTATSTVGAPRIESHGAIWTGSRMMISGGNDNIFNTVGRPFSGNAYTYDPVTDSWQPSGFMGVLKAAHMMLMAGDIILVFGGSVSIRNPITLEYAFTGYTPHGSRYFLNGTNTSETRIANPAKLYLYIKQ